MGIVNIHLIKPDDRRGIQDQEALEAKLIRDHQKGKHATGRVWRECPLCRRYTNRGY